MSEPTTVDTCGSLRARLAAHPTASPLQELGGGTSAPDARIGEFTLRRDQRRTLALMLRALDRFGGVLVVDPPGTGKTVLALAAAHRLAAAPALVIAPAALRSQWIEAAARATVAIRFTSMESMSRGARPNPAPLTIVDEAHHARTTTTARYRRLAACCAASRVILLSATPVVNRGEDRDALLALFLGAAASRAEAATACIVGSGIAGDLPTYHEDVGVSATRPTVRRLGAIARGSELGLVAEAIAALPPPLPLSAGSPATALIAMSLAVAWRSSVAALDVALRRRIQRGEAMRDLLDAGRRPTHTMLRHWTLHVDGMQLALGALLADPRDDQAVTTGARDEVIAALDRHLSAVRALRSLVRPHRDADAVARADGIIALAARHPERRLVVFARHAETIRALYGALRGEPGVVAIVGARVLAAAGRWSRDEVLRAVGPRARPLRHDDPRAIRILLATDVVAEGVEMQGIGVVVHADVPWTPARIEQRVGRVRRAGSAMHEVLVAHIAAPRAAQRLVRLGARLRRKSDARIAALSEAKARASIDVLLAAWRRATPREGAERTTDDGAPLRSVMRCEGLAHAVFLARLDGHTPWLVGVLRGRRWRIRASARAVLLALRRIDRLRDPSITVHRGLGRIERVVQRALARRAARALLTGDAAAAATSPSGSGPTPATARRIAAVRARLGRALARAPGLARSAIAARHASLLAALARPIPVATEHRLDALLRDAPDDATFTRALGALLHRAVPHHQAESPPGAPDGLRDLVLLVPTCARPTASAPPAASPGTAAPRRSAPARPPSRRGSPGAA